MMIAKRWSNKDQVSSFKDWYLLGLVVGLGVTGLLTEIIRLGGLYGVSALFYYIHLILVWSLFAYTPFSKLAHIVYRTVAMAYQEYSGRTYRLDDIINKKGCLMFDRAALFIIIAIRLAHRLRRCRRPPCLTPHRNDNCAETIGKSSFLNILSLRFLF